MSNKSAAVLAAESGAPEEARQPATIETCTCTVRLGNDVRNEVILHKVTPPELILLRSIHGGAESVVSVTVDGSVRYGPANERVRLLTKYARHTKLIGEMFPGLSPRFPLTIAEAEDMASAELRQSEIEQADSPLE